MRFPQDAEGWPMRAHSRMVLCRPHRWHVQQAGSGPAIVLIHGAGGATQSWRGLFPLLAQDHQVTAIDLPGQGFTQSGAQGRCGLDAMAQDLAALLDHLQLNPAALVGHSAGAAIALRLVELGAAPAARVIGINPALAPFQGIAGWLFPVMARALALTPFAARLFAATTTPASVDRLLRGTGSRIGAEGAALYLRLARDPAHVDATLSMMAQWDLTGLLARMARITAPVLLIAGLRDTAVPPSVAQDAARTLPRARLVTLPDLGHLAHEEDPATIAALIRDDLAREPAPDPATSPSPGPARA